MFKKISLPRHKFPASSFENLKKNSRKRLMIISTSRDFQIGVILFAVFLAALLLIQFATPGLVGNDGYYHIKAAYILRTEGLKPDFNWLPLTILNAENYYDHHYLFHILMILFTFGDLRIGAKLASVFFPTLAFLSIWYLLKKQKVPYAELWSLGLLIISEAFIYRMNMPRAQSLSLLLLVWTLHVLLQKEYKWLTLLGFLYVWSYNAFPLIVIVVFLYLVAHLLTERKLVWTPLVYAVGGVVLGLVINPYFPENLLFIYRHITPKLFDMAAVPVGNEWSPYRTATLLENSGFALLIFASGIVALGLKSKKMNVATATSLFLTLTFSFMLFEARRFIEYAPPFMLIFAAFAWQPVLEEIRQNEQEKSKRSPVMRLAPIFVLVLFMPLAWGAMVGARKQLQESGRPYQRYQGASAWLVANTPEDSRVFQTDWDDFPQLFFHNHHNTYTIGLDPTYMEIYDPALYAEWVAITRGKMAEIGEKIKNDFSGDYVITGLSQTRFIKKVEGDENLELVYEDGYAKIYKVLP